MIRPMIKALYLGIPNFWFVNYDSNLLRPESWDYARDMFFSWAIFRHTSQRCNTNTLSLLKVFIGEGPGHGTFAFLNFSQAPTAATATPARIVTAQDRPAETCPAGGCALKDAAANNA